MVAELENLDTHPGRAIPTLEFLTSTVVPELRKSLAVTDGSGSANLTDGEAYEVVTEFVGIREEGVRDLLGFTHATLTEFLRYVAEVPNDILKPADLGSKKDRLLATLQAAAPDVQLRILRALLRRFEGSAHQDQVPSSRENARAKVQAMADRLSGEVVEIPDAANAAEHVREALVDAKGLLQTPGPSSALDRVHTGIHAYLRHLCDDEGIVYESDDSINRLYSLLSDEHPRLPPPVEWDREIDSVMKVQSTVLARLSEARNQTRRAHPNAALPDPEAQLMINAATTFYRYLESKTGER